MGLTTPESKMSKSDKDPNGCVYMLEKPEDIARKFKRAVTDSDTEHCVRYDPTAKPGVSNLMQIYAAATGKTYEDIEAEFQESGYDIEDAPEDAGADIGADFDDGEDDE